MNDSHDHCPALAQTVTSFRVALNQTRTRANLDSVLARITSNATDPRTVQLLRESASREAHPIFRADRWVDVSDEDLLRGAPGTIFASRLLHTEKLIRFFHALEFGHRFQARGIDGEMAQVKAMLNDLAGAVTFCIGSGRAVRGATHHRPNDNLFGPISRAPVAGHLKIGVFSRIMIHIDTIFAKLDCSTMTHDQLLRQWFLLAMTLVHELAHAYYLARYGSGEELDFIYQDTFIEMGDAVQKWIFGGRFEADDSVDAVVYMRQLPFKSRSDAYNSTPQGQQNSMPLSQPVPETSEAKYIVDQEWASKSYSRH